MLVLKGFAFDRIAGDVDVTGFPIWGTIYGVWNIEFILGSFLFGILVATTAGIIPAQKAAKMEITKALRFV